MYRLWKTLLNYVLLLSSDAPAVPQDAVIKSTPAKSILIVGGGTGGLGALKTFLDLPERIRGDWEIALYEKRDDIGGVWLPDPNPPRPPALPETPLHPSLHTNAPVPFMTCPQFPFPPGTPLFARHDYIRAYHIDFASHYHLLPNIHLNHNVLSASWVGNSSYGHWNVTASRATDGSVFHKSFDHIIVAAGNNHHPYSPTWEGVEGWRANTPPGSPKRDILHSLYYRDPEQWRGRTVIVVGGSASGRDISTGLEHSARKVYQSVDENPVLPPKPPTIRKSKISHFTNTSIIFMDGTSISDADSVILATGFESRIPFLSEGRALAVDPMTRSPLNSSAEPGHLTTNLRYIRPFFNHITSLSSSFPSNALSMIGLAGLTLACTSDIAETIFIINTILDPSLLPPRSEALAQLRQEEQNIRDHGYDPDHVGHLIVGDRSFGYDFQDGIVEWLRERDAPYIPLDPKQAYIDWWRRDLMNWENVRCLVNGWARIEKLGEEEMQKWVRNLESDEDWAEMMTKLVEHEKEVAGTCGELYQFIGF